MQSKRKLAMYIRLSAEDADLRTSGRKTESNSIANQRKLLMDYYCANSKLQEYDIVEFCDDGYSGTNFNRPRFMDMMALVRQREIHCIMVKDLSRFGREYLEVGAYLELILPIFGTRFISVNDNFDSSNYVGTTGGLELALRNLINGLYSKDLSVKVRSAIKTRNRRGQYWGGGSFYGYQLDPRDKHKLIVDEEVRPVVQQIFELCIEGLSTSEIAQRLNEKGVSPPVVRKKQLGQAYNGRVVEKESIWLASTIRKILNDGRYTGKMISGTRESVGISTNKTKPLPKEQWIVVDGTHEAIITQEIFCAARDSLQSRIKTRNSNTAGNRADNLFVCGYCGRKLQKANGKITHLFCLKARNVTDSDCASLYVPMELLQENTLRTIRMLARLLIDKHIQEQASSDSQIAELEKEIAAFHKKLQGLNGGKLDLYEDYRCGKLTREQYICRQKERQEEANYLQKMLQDHTEELETLKAQIESMKKVMGTARDVLALSEYRPEVIRKLVNRVHVYADGRLELDLTCKDAFAVELLNQVNGKAS